MSNALAIYDASNLSESAKTPVDAPFDYTAEAIAAIADLDDESRIEKMLRVGAAIAAAKEVLPHGSLTNWYKNDLKKSESWCSTYFRLYAERCVLQDALDWAARIGHKLAGRYAIDQLLKIIAEYKVKVLGKGAPASRTPWTPKPVVANVPSNDTIGQLREILVDAEALRLELALAPSPDDGAAKETLSSLAQRIEHRLRALIETCSSLQV
jgi:hypothetical protein